MDDTAGVHAYRAFGLTIVSEFEISQLSGARIEAVGAVSGDVAVGLGRLSGRLPRRDRGGSHWAVRGSEFVLRAPEVGVFHAAHGDRITVDPDPGADPAAIEVFLLGSCLGAILHQRREFVLHASSFALEGVAYAICGNSGSGKSTTTAAMLRRGARFLGDDICLVRREPVPTVVPAHPAGKLDRISLEANQVSSSGLQRLRLDRNKFLRRYTMEFHDEPTPLRAIFVLGFGDATGPARSSSIERASLRGALRLLFRHTYQRRFIPPTSNDHAGAMMAELAAGTPVYKIARPRAGDTFAVIPELVSRTIEQLGAERSSMS
ncbi:MAG: hypothetical protein KDB21_04870 [Acidimicrobiales bacterium]|nr:hypothetical protein [Acidimicrobiales bacterium]